MDPRLEQLIAQGMRQQLQPVAALAALRCQLASQLLVALAPNYGDEFADGDGRITDACKHLVACSVAGADQLIRELQSRPTTTAGIQG